jgi:dTDP-4-amino-4,6-dideoxygalactose transaminase
MKYPMFKVHIDTAGALEQIEPVLNSGFVNEGEQVTELTNYFSEYFQHNRVMALNSCTSALTLALKLCDVMPDDEIIATSMTCVASNTPIHTFGAKVIWADINHKTGNIEPDNIEKLITPKTKALLCVNWSGLPCDLEKIYNICEENNIKFIQDAAHSMGATYKGKQSHHFAHYTCYSLQAIKHITTGDGGLLVVNTNDDDFQRAKALKWFGIDRDSTKDEKGEWKGQRWEMDVVEAGFKFHMNNITAAIGLSQIPHMGEIIDTHRRNGLLYEELFSDERFVNGLSYPKDSSPTFWVYTAILSEHLDRDKILQELNDEGINAGVVHVPNHYYTCFKESFTDLPETDYFSKHQISLPCGWWLDEKDIRVIANSLLQKCEENSNIRK